MYKNNNNVTCVVDGLNLIINTENGAVAGVSEEELADYNNLNEEAIKDNSDFYKFLIDNEILFTEEPKKKPRTIQTAYLHVTNKCNLHCLGCYSENDDRNKADDLNTDQFKHILSELKRVQLTNLVISGGEPLFRKDIAELMRYAREECDIKNITLITNGTIDKPEIFSELSKYLDTIAVSIDTYCSSCPAFLRDEGIFDKIMRSIDHMKACGLNVSILPTLHHKNVGKMADYIKLADKLHTQISFSIFTTCNSDIYDGYHLDEEDLQLLAEHFSMHDINIEDIPLNNTLEGKKRCGTGCSMLAIATNGDVYPCHMLMEEQFKLGSLIEKGILEIFADSEATNIANQLDVDNLSECGQCKYKYLCGGGCRARAYLKTGDIKKADPFCEMYKGFYENMFDNMKLKVGV